MNPIQVEYRGCRWNNWVEITEGVDGAGVVEGAVGVEGAGGG